MNNRTRFLIIVVSINMFDDGAPVVEERECKLKTELYVFKSYSITMWKSDEIHINHNYRTL